MKPSLFEHVISVLADDSGVLRSKHGDRLVVLYARGVAIAAYRHARASLPRLVRVMVAARQYLVA
jgi:hypothetical protein